MWGYFPLFCTGRTPPPFRIGHFFLFSADGLRLAEYRFRIEFETVNALEFLGVRGRKSNLLQVSVYISFTLMIVCDY
jgi:hypothetical protein